MSAVRRAIFLIAILFSGASYAQSIDIASMTWTQRSDWINVKTDSNVSPHAVGDGVTDDTAALQSALTFAQSPSNRYSGKKIVYIPAGTYKITNTLTWSGIGGGAIIGCGKDTIIKWYGSSGAAMFWCQGNTRTRFIGLAWDGNGLAGCGFLHRSIGLYESRMRHENESFKNFIVSGTYSPGQTLPAAGIMSGLMDATTPTAETMIWNCLFYNCTVGAVVGWQVYNNYMWLFDGCEFENCGTGVIGGDGKYTITNTHFAGSTVADTGGGVTARIRHCTSVGSAGFIIEGGPSGATSMGVIQDCWIDGWTGNLGAIRFGLRGPDNVFDCVFTHPPTGAVAPINLMSSAVNLIASNNYYPGLPNLTYGNASPNLVTVTSGSLSGPISALSSPNTTFLQTTWPSDSANILDVTKAPYNIPLNSGSDCTATLQQAINDAKAANNGSIVYLPLNAGTGYCISRPLNLSGSNYKLQGSGLWTKILWTGTGIVTGGTMISVTNPQNISIEQLALEGTNNTTNMVVVTSTGASSLTLDGLYTYYAGTWNSDGPGVVLSNLPAGSVVYAPHLDAPLTVNDCGAAQIFVGYLCIGQVTVQGATHPKTGFLGAAIVEGMQLTPTGYNITVNDNQDLVFGDYYDEQSYNDLNLQGGSATWTGRVTIQGFKEQCNTTSTQININNYAGRLMYGPQSFSNNITSTVITQTGSNAVDLILPGNVYWNGTPTITTGPSCNLIEAGNLNILSGTTTAMANVPTTLTSANLASMAGGFDHLRQLGAVNLAMNYGILQTVANSSFATDPLNSSPLTVMGTAPAAWTVTGGTATGSGVRAVSVTGTGSAFASGTQSADFVDTTGTAVGNPLSFQQTTAALPSSSGAVLSFDFLLNSMASLNDALSISAFAGASSVFSINLTASGTAGLFGSAPLALNTWYRVRAIIPPPASLTGTIVYTVTPWTANGPGSTSTYTASGASGSLNQGLSKILFAQAAAGNNTNINFDNITFVAGDPLVSMPSILAQPADQTVTFGQSATFTVTAATATGSPTYQWQENGVNIPGATAASYTIPATAGSDIGATLTVVVGDSAGGLTVTSDPAALTVNAPPGYITITTQPLNTTVFPGQTASFTVAASSTSPLAYQWFENGLAIAGGTFASYATSAAVPSDDGSTFSVQVISDEGVLTSNAAVLSVLNPPIFEADFNGTGGGTGGAGDMVALGGTGALGTSSQSTYTIKSTSSMGQGNYLNHAAAAAANTNQQTVATFTPATTANSWRALTGTVISGTTTYLALNGAFDIFVRPNASAGSDQSWFRPIDFDSRSGNSGMRIILTGAGTGLQFQLVSNSSQAFGTNGVTWNASTETKNVSYVFASGTVNHIGLTMNTDPGTGLVTTNFYGLKSGGAIATSSTANLLGTMTFYANAAVTGSNALGTGAWAMVARSSANWVATNADYDTVRLYNSDPGNFPANGTASPAGTAPTITAGPQSMTVSASQTATFTVAATGAPAPGYQWKKNGALIVGATSASYTTPVTLLSDNGSTFTVVVNNTAGSFASGTATLTVNPSYASWAGAYFSSGQLADPTVSGLTANLAGDGMSNLLKYALGLNPNVNGLSQRPAVIVQGSAGTRYLQISYRQQKSATDITYTVQVCGDMSGWHSGAGYTAPVGSPADNGDGTQTVVVRDAITSGPSQPRRFIRLQVTKP